MFSSYDQIALRALRETYTRKDSGERAEGLAIVKPRSSTQFENRAHFFGAAAEAKV